MTPPGGAAPVGAPPLGMPMGGMPPMDPSMAMGGPPPMGGDPMMAMGPPPPPPDPTMQNPFHGVLMMLRQMAETDGIEAAQQVYNFLLEYADSEGIEGDDLIFPIGVRAVQKHLKKVCDWLGPEYEDISTHSFRKYFGTEIYYKNGKDIELVRRLYQHSSAAVTARYLGVTDEKIEQALDSHVDIIYRPK